jgi:lipopolysaccharide export system permease protein
VIKILDRYLARQFVRTFLFGLLAFVIIFIILDMTENLDDFVDANMPAQLIAHYYLAFIPEMIMLMIPVALLLSALFVTGRLSNQNELAAIKSSGMSIYRLLVPFLVIAVLVTGFTVYLTGWLVPMSNRTKYAYERKYLHRNIQSVERTNIIFQDSRTRIVYVGFYDIETKRANAVSIQDFADTNSTVLLHRLDAQTMQWEGDSDALNPEAQGRWILHSGTERDFEKAYQGIEFFTRHDVGRLTITPSDIEKKQRKPEEMSYTELREFIDNQERAGQNVARWLVDYYSKMSFPCACLVVVLFGVPFSANRRRGVAVEFGISVAVTFIYLAFMKASQVFGYNGDLNPLLTAWLANGVFLTAGIVNLVRVNK